MRSIKELGRDGDFLKAFLWPGSQPIFPGFGGERNNGFGSEVETVKRRADEEHFHASFPFSSAEFGPKQPEFQKKIA